MGGMAGGAEEARLPHAAALRADVEERRGAPLAARNDPDLATFVGDEQPAAAVARVDDPERIARDRGDRLGGDADGGRVEARPRDARGWRGGRGPGGRRS